MGSERSENEEFKQNITQVLLTLICIYVTIGYYALDQQQWYYLRDNVVDNVVCKNICFFHASIVQTVVGTARFNNHSVQGKSTTSYYNLAITLLCYGCANTACTTITKNHRGPSCLENNMA